MTKIPIILQVVSSSTGNVMQIWYAFISNASSSHEHIMKIVVDLICDKITTVEITFFASVWYNRIRYLDSMSGEVNWQFNLLMRP